MLKHSRLKPIYLHAYSLKVCTKSEARVALNSEIIIEVVLLIRYLHAVYSKQNQQKVQLQNSDSN